MYYNVYILCTIIAFIIECTIIALVTYIWCAITVRLVVSVSMKWHIAFSYDHEHLTKWKNVQAHAC